MKIKIEHIFHSGFIMETEDIQMVFDYYKGDIDLKDKKTIVFATHGHGDHYTEEIYDWEKSISDIDYVLGFDIGDAPKADNIHIMNPYESLDIDTVNIKSFGSTDQGLSLLIAYRDVNIYFAGDLNWWHWENDTPEVQKDEERQFTEEIAKVLKENAKIDIAFSPVDPRLGVGYSFGGQYIIEKFKPTYFFPMHFGDKFDTSKRFINKMGDIDTKIVDINKKNQITEIEV